MEHEATYAPEDNKLRLYAAARLDADEYAAVKKAGFRWAPKQELFVAPSWSPAREDVLLEMCGEIGDENYSPEDRAADRAERFGGYRDKRRAEAGGHADTFDAGPAVFGHQNRARAERAAKRHDRHRGHALTQWGKAEYWQMRTAGVIAHALYKAKPSVRRGRIKRLEAEQRKHLKGIKAAQALYDGWAKVAGMAGADELLPLDEAGYAITDEMNDAQQFAYFLSNDCRSLASFYHPTSEEANEEAKRVWGHGFSAYDFLTDDEFIGKPFERFTPKRYAELYVSRVTTPDDPSGWSHRWTRHYELRLSYERAMLGNEGGTAEDADMAPGGWIAWRGRWPIPAGRYQIQRVNKSRATGAVSSVMVEAPAQHDYDDKGNPWSESNPRPLVLHKVEVARLPQDAYTPPTPEDVAAMQARGKKKPKAPPLLNPSEEDAQRLQALWNQHAGDGKHSEVRQTTQAKYSRWSKGDMAHTEGIDAKGRRARWSKKPAVFRVRLSWQISHADEVIVLTDKPGKPLPLDWEVIEAPAEVTV